MKNEFFPQSRQSDLVTQNLNDEVLVYDLKTHKAISLNSTSFLVWQECDGIKTVAEITRSISKKLNSPATEDLVWLAIDQLKKEDLMINSDELTSKFRGVSRRDVIKRVGLGTMIALPVISSLVAPGAASAASTFCSASCVGLQEVNNCQPGFVCCGATNCNGGTCSGGTCFPADEDCGLTC